MIIDKRFQFLTSKQRVIAEIAKEKGYVLLGEVKVLYSSKEHWERALEKLTTFNILIPNKSSGEGNILFKKFEYNPYPEINNIQKTLDNKPEIQEQKDTVFTSGISKEEMRRRALKIIEAPGQE